MVRVATFDWKAARPLPEQRAATLSLWRWVGLAGLAAGGGLVYLANHQYYHLTGKPADILRTYNRTWWASRLLTGSSALLFARNQFWLFESTRRNWGAKPLFHSLQNKKYAEIRQVVEADEWGFLNDEDIWALLKPAFDELGCTQFWKHDKEGAQAFLEMIKTIVAEAAQEPAKLLGKGGFFEKHGFLPIENDWIDEKDLNRLTKKVERIVTTVGPVAFIGLHGAELLQCIKDQTLRNTIQEKYAEECYLTEFKDVPSSLGFTAEKWKELSDKHKLAGVKSWKDYATLRQNDGAKEACDLMLSTDKGREFVLLWMQEVGYREFKDSHEFSQLKEALSLENYFAEEANALSAEEFFAKHGWPKEAPKSKYMEAVKEQLQANGLTNEVAFYSILGNTLKQEVISYYADNITTECNVEKIREADVKLREIFDVRWEGKKYPAIAETERDLFWWALKLEAYKPSEWTDLEASVQAELKDCEATALNTTYATAIDLGCINPEWKAVQKMVLTYCLQSFDPQDELCTFLLENKLIPAAGVEAIEACAQQLEKATKAFKEKCTKWEENSRVAKEKLAAWLDKRETKAAELDGELKALTAEIRRLSPETRRTADNKTQERIRKLEEEIFDLREELGIKGEEKLAVVGVENAEKAKQLEEKKANLKSLYQSLAPEKQLTDAHNQGFNQGKLEELRKQAAEKLLAAEEYKRETSEKKEAKTADCEKAVKESKTEITELEKAFKEKVAQLEKDRKLAFGVAMTKI